MRTITLWATTVALSLGTTIPTTASEKVDRSTLGRSVKLRILVDKVMQPEAGWVTEEWMVRATAEAGFNVFSPRRGHEKLDEVRQVTQWCTKYGIYHMPWMRGTLSAPAGAAADGKRVVWSGGSEQPLWSPNSDEFWEWTSRYVVEYAKISAENDRLMGVFLDYENYAPGTREGNLYYLSYDDLILTAFAESRQLELPRLDLGDRKGWLQKQGLHDAFAVFQTDHWRDRCRTLREAVDRVEPTFQFCIYPAPGTPFMVEATYPEWATEKAPLILADASTYGRPSRFLPEQEALAANRKKLIARRKVAEQAGIRFIYTGGIDPVVTGADPEFSGKNAVAISEVTDGYWIFYEGPAYTRQDHADYWKWFTWANGAIAEGRYDARLDARQTPENWTLDVFEHMGRQPGLVAPEAAGQPTKLPDVRLRRENVILLACRSGQPVKLALENLPVAQYESLLVWDVRNSQLAQVASGKIPHGKTATVSFTPKADGVYLMGASASSCAYSIRSSNVPVGLYAGEPLKLIRGAKRLFFNVPEGVTQFTLAVEGAGAETVRCNVLDPDGNPAATGETTLENQKAEVRVVAGDRAGGTWSLELTRAAEGVLEDSSIRLDANLPPTLSLVPEHVFGLRREK
ncbi:MAG: hypothetical protein ACYTG0_01175 [Planctomycetota bacterium]|jgi:hypothetical protein